MRTFIFIVLLTIIGGFFRFHNLYWDNGHFFHPDERNIAAAVSRIHFFEQLNPGFFTYGSFLMYLYRATGELSVKLTNDNAWVYNWGNINVISRFYSALFSTLTIPIIFLLAQKIFTKEVALLSAFFSVFVVSFIQTAHFGITENFLVLNSVIIALLSFNIYKKINFKNSLFLGIALGISTASKITALSFFIFPLFVYLLHFLKDRHIAFKKSLFVLLTILSSIVTFTLFSPYTFLNWGKFLESMRYESGVALGTLSVPYTLQFTNSTPYLFQIKNLFWQMGPLAFFGLLGFVLLVIRVLKIKDKKLLILISFPIFYFLYVGYWHTKFIRFMLPILPFLIISASWLFFHIKEKYKLFGNLLIVSFCLITTLWALAFFSIYTREQTRVSASKWIYQNIPSGSKILGEHWDDGLPIILTNNNPSRYSIEQLTIYEPDNQDKINYYAEKLSNADYIILNSRRLYGTLINLPEKYPITSRYYRLLFNGELGYKKIAEFTSYPSVFGIEINNDSSEETFQVYDHPKVLIFKNTERSSVDELLKALLIR